MPFLKKPKFQGSKHCWSCGRMFRTKKGGGYTFALVRDPLGAEMRVHKDCVRDAVGGGYKEVTP